MASATSSGRSSPESSPTWFSGSPPSSAREPEMVIKGGFIAWSQMGDPNASIPTPQPVYHAADVRRLRPGRRPDRRWRSSALLAGKRHSAAIRPVETDRAGAQLPRHRQEGHASSTTPRRKSRSIPKPITSAPMACTSPANRRSVWRWHRDTVCSDDSWQTFFPPLPVLRGRDGVGAELERSGVFDPLWSLLPVRRPSGLRLSSKRSRLG